MHLIMMYLKKDLKLCKQLLENIKTMSKKENGRKWDGITRVSNHVYRKRFDEIFGKKENDELKESYEQSLKNKKERDVKKK